MDTKVFHSIRSSLFKLGSAIIALSIIFLINTQAVFSSSQSELKTSDLNVIEYLRLDVNKNDKEAWLTAEKQSWAPWLEKQKGFISRELLWDPNNEEALLLISWASRSDWKSIPQSEIDKVQILFEKVAIELTQNNFVNPFPLKSNGEFLPQ